ncbi:MAG: DUF3099 domain-containing protein [Nocardioides sp.]
MALRDRHHTAEAVRITTAPRSRAEDIAARQKRYIYSMGLRTVCFVGAVVVGGGWLMWAFLVGAIFLPYVAVVMANAGPGRNTDAALRQVGGAERELSPGASERPIDPAAGPVTDQG